MKPAPFEVALPEAELRDARRRLESARLPHDVANTDWSYGTNGAYLRELIDYWIDGFDWYAQAAAMNEWPHFRVVLDDVPIHYAVARGQGPAPLPLVLSHGWPWTFWDFKDVIGPLSDPAAHGGDARDAFDVVVPSLPGFAFSTPLTVAGVNASTTADLWLRLMVDVLGYDRFAAAGGDWGNLITVQLGHKYPGHLVGIHTLGRAAHPGMFVRQRPWDPWGDTLYALPESYRPAFIEFHSKWASHVATQTQDPQTLAYAMHDSPAGMCAWLLERRRSWSDCGGDVERCFSKDFLITTTLLYWATGAFVSSVRYYREAWLHPWRPERDGEPLVTVPTGMTVFLHETPQLPPEHHHAHARMFGDICHIDQQSRGGHFSAVENPAAVVDGIRATFRGLR